MMDIGPGLLVLIAWLGCVVLGYLIFYLVVKTAIVNGIKDSGIREDIRELRKAVEKS